MGWQAERRLCQKGSRVEFSWGRLKIERRMVLGGFAWFLVLFCLDLYNAVMEYKGSYTAKSLYIPPIWGFIQHAV